MKLAGAPSSTSAERRRAPVVGRRYARAIETLSRTACLVALLRSAKRPSNVYADLVEDAGDVWGLVVEELGLLSDELIERARAEVVRWEEDGTRVLTVLDEGYPENLRAVYDRPLLVFVSGRLEPADARAVAVIGSRSASPVGLETARAVGAELARRRFTVASGLARGIDTAAHTSALEHNARTIAVIGTGLEHCYPPENGDLQARIAQAGAVVSQFWPDSPPSRESFPTRNALMSGISLATVVVQAGPRSGARTQIRRALAHGRPVLLMEPMMSEDWAQELSARPGVHVVSAPGDVPAVVERLTSTDALVA